MSRVIVVIRKYKKYIPWMNIDEKIKWWNELFKIPFTDFRREMSNIAFNNHNLINADKIYYTLDEFIVDQQLIQPSDWILPIDDDDWLCNNIGQSIRNLDTNSNFISWKCNIISVFKLKDPDWKLERIQSSIQEHISRKNFVFSCCYALKDATATQDNLFGHMNLMNIDREYIPKPELESCYIHLPQSTMCLLRHTESKDDLLKSIKEVDLLNENVLTHKPEFVSKLRLVKDLFASL